MSNTLLTPVGETVALPLQEPAIGRLAEVFADHPTTMLSLHDAEGFYTFASSAASDLLGCEPGELVGTFAYERFHPDDVGRIRHSHTAIVDYGASSSVDYRIHHADGHWVPVRTLSWVVPETAAVGAGTIVCMTFRTPKQG